MIKKIIIFLFFFLALRCETLVCQIPDNITRQEILQLQIRKLSVKNDSVFTKEKNIITGKNFYSGGNKFTHPYYGDNLWVPAEIYSSGENYKQDLVKYDIYLDYLVLLHTYESHSYPIYLNKEIVDQFTINNHHFIFLPGFGAIMNNISGPGYYEDFYTGKTKLFIRHVKIKQFDYDQRANVYSGENYLFLEKDGNYFTLTRKNSLLKALSDHKKDIRSFMKKNKLFFSPGDYQHVDEILRYYDTL